MEEALEWWEAAYPSDAVFAPTVGVPAQGQNIFPNLATQS